MPSPFLGLAFVSPDGRPELGNLASPLGSVYDGPHFPGEETETPQLESGGQGLNAGLERVKKLLWFLVRCFLVCLYLFLWDVPMSREGNEDSFQLPVTEWWWLPGLLC